MNSIRRVLDDLKDSDAMAAELQKKLDERPGDDVLRVNAAAIAKRKSDLLRRLDHQLKVQQHDLIEYSIMRRSDNYPH